MGRTGASLKRSVITMSITLVVTIVVLFASCSAPEARGMDARASPSSERFSKHAKVTTGPQATVAGDWKQGQLCGQLIRANAGSGADCGILHPRSAIRAICESVASSAKFTASRT